MTLSANHPPLKERTIAKLLAGLAAARGDEAFLLYRDSRYSYREADDLSTKLAQGLHAAGIRHGDHVAVMLENAPEVMWLHFALAKIGAVCVPVNNAVKGDLLSYYFKQSDSVALVVDDAYVDRCAAVQAQCPLLKLVIAKESEDEVWTYVHGDDRPPMPDLAASFPDAHVMRYEEVARGHAHLAAEHAAAWAAREETKYSDMLHILYTSGTTGPSKGSMVSNATAIAVSLKYLESYGYTTEDVLYTCLPLFHGNSLNCTVFPALLAGGKVALSRRFSARNFWPEVRKFGATQFSLLSAMTNILWMQPESPQDREHRARLCQIIPTPPFFAEFEKRYNIRITSLYSLSDYGMASMYGPDAPREKWRSAGKLVPEMSTVILDDDDLPVPTGTIGQICMRSNEPWFSRQGYYKMAEAFTKACRNLWFHTGDRGYIDEDGYLYFVDRMKEVIRRRGENVSAVEVEHVIQRHPSVLYVAVYPVRSEFSEDEVMASIVLKEGAALDAEALIAHCQPQMAYFMVPRFVEFVNELPVTPSGKVEKYKLRASAEPRLADIWDREKSGIVLQR
ncbi:AMP-binding protein [Ramlibacter sp.]|uniref:AMP-binding protein n=1 Tax=Ramlibacter sp. TaxID=1917967 RepID=UPI003D120E84